MTAEPAARRRRRPLSAWVIQRRARIVAVLAALLVGLVAAELAVRIGGWDWRRLERRLYLLKVDVQCHQTDPDPAILYRLKPGVCEVPRVRAGVTDMCRIEVNSFGARAPERPRQKPPGVFRILVIGASNVYGYLQDNDHTWPARLEQELNRDAPGRYEVWNFGVSAYAGRQMAAVGREMTDKLSPDLVLFALSNTGMLTFLPGSPLRDYFTRDPLLWRDTFEDRRLPGGKWLSFETRLRLMRHVALYRLLAVSLNQPTEYEAAPPLEGRNIEMAREYLKWAKTRTRVALVFAPGLSADQYQAYWEGLGLPIIALNADGLPDEYRDLHPPSYVYEWYGRRLAPALLEKGLVEKPAAQPRDNEKRAR